MAIYSSVPHPDQQPQPVDVEAWTVGALQSLSLSTAGGTFSIPLDIVHDGASAPKKGVASATRPKAFQRDSQKRREALLKGKEGSRRRQRWENDHLLHVPNVQPPLPSDWEVHPTHPVHHVPYYLAPLWDAGVRHRAEQVALAKQYKSASASGKTTGGVEGRGRVPQELRAKLKKAKGAKSLLQDLEDEIRAFVKEWEEGNKRLQGRGHGKKDSVGSLELDSGDEEIVFVGRDGTMSDEQRESLEKELEREKLVWEGLENDRGASFGRWLVHSIAAYYGLNSRSVTVGARRESYVGIKSMKTGRRLSNVQTDLPRPLYGLI